MNSILTSFEARFSCFLKRPGQRAARAATALTGGSAALLLLAPPALFGQVNDPFKSSLTEKSGGASISLGEGAKKTLPPLGDKGPRKEEKKASGPGISGATQITAKKRLVFDPKSYEAVFTGEVNVLDPRFTLSCETLTAFLRRSDKESKSEKPESHALEPQAAGAAKGGGQKAKEAAPDTDPKAGGLEKAIAEGSVVIRQEKLNDKGEVEQSTGRAQKAVYEADSGNITLSGWPQVEQQNNTIVATEEGTVIILNRRGSLEVIGQSKSVLRNTNLEDGR